MNVHDLQAVLEDINAPQWEVDIEMPEGGLRVAIRSVLPVEAGDGSGRVVIRCRTSL